MSATGFMMPECFRSSLLKRDGLYLRVDGPIRDAIATAMPSVRVEGLVSSADMSTPSSRLAFLAVQDVHNTCGGKSWKYVYDHAEFSSWYTHVDEHLVREKFWSRITPGEVVFDIGAGFGSYTLPALARGAAHVVAWSPEVWQPSILQKSLEANGWQDRCTIIQAGLWSRDGWLMAKTGTDPSDFWAPEVEHPAEAFPVATLDSWMSAFALHRADWLKLDVEGGECEVLLGAVETIKRFRPRILVECHLFKDERMEERVDDIVRPLGYRAVDALRFNVAAAGQDLAVSHVLWETR